MIATRYYDAQYICTSCVRRIPRASNRTIRTRCATGPNDGHRTISSSSRRSPSITPRRTQSPPNLPHRYGFSTSSSKKPLRMAVIGSGPAGFYTAYRVMSKVQDAIVDMYEQLPVPYGLVRFGVAPDHPEVKNCEEKFEEVAESPRFNYVGNVKVGQDVAVKDMKPHYDAILFSYGASEDRRLHIPGEDLRGVFSAREFVGWYNGLPQFQGLDPNLADGDQAVVIGQGNVAIDVARILLSPFNALRHTDITEQALESLSRSRIESVKVVGRRGPLQAAFTAKEARELMNMPGVAFRAIDSGFYPLDIKKLPRIQRRIGEILLKGSKASLSDTEKSWALEFLLAPNAMNAGSDSNNLASVDFTRQEFSPGADNLAKNASVSATSETVTIPATLAFRSVGYKAAEIPGLAELGVHFDHKLGIIPNDPYGRIITPSAGPGDLAASHIPGLYCAGWVKRGPTGVIASTMDDAFTSGDVIATDWHSGVPFLNTEHGNNGSTGMGWDGVKDLVTAQGIRPLEWKDWKRIDAAERARGRNLGKEREKFGSVKEMLESLDS